MRSFLVILAVLLAVLHQDFWWWDDTTIVLGFVPIGLAYHALFSILAACLWALFVKYRWPEDLEAYATGPAEGGEKP